MSGSAALMICHFDFFFFFSSMFFQWQKISTTRDINSYWNRKLCPNPNQRNRRIYAGRRPDQCLGFNWIDNQQSVTTEGNLGWGGTHHGLVMSQTWFSDRQGGDLYVGGNSVSAPAQCVLVMEDLTLPYLDIEEREGCIRCSCTVKRLRSPHYSTPLKFVPWIVHRGWWWGGDARGAPS